MEENAHTTNDSTTTEDEALEVGDRGIVDSCATTSDVVPDPVSENPVVTANSDETANEAICSVDDIGVTLDYQPPVGSNDADGSAENSQDAASVITIRTGRSTREDRRRRRQRRNEIGLIQFYSKHWFSQCVSGFFTGLIFFVIGIVFVVYLKELPNYIGVLFILVSFPPCCMAINRWRSARRSQQQNREVERRRREIRRRREEDGAEDGAYRDGELPYSDLPPSYENLGFDANEFAIVIGSTGETRSSSFISDDAPPAYSDALILQKLKQEEAFQKCNKEPPDINDLITEGSTGAVEEDGSHRPSCSST